MAAINNGFSMGYPQYYQPNYGNYSAPAMYPQPQQSSNNGMIWVQGIGGAKSYLVGPNATAILWDSEAQVIYLKSADASGMPSMKILDYTFREDTQNNASPSGSEEIYATKEDLENLRTELRNIKNSMKRKEYNKNE